MGQCEPVFRKSLGKPLKNIEQRVVRREHDPWSGRRGGGVPAARGAQQGRGAAAHLAGGDPGDE